MEISDRREYLVTDRNPDCKLDYVITVAGRMAICDVKLRYVPDRMILQPLSFGAYLDAIGAVRWSGLEDAAAAIVNDVNNQLIARWVQVWVAAPDHGETAIERHEVLLEDSQPNWENKGLLSRLKRY